MSMPSRYIYAALILLLTAPIGTAAQSRTFGQTPDYLLGLRSDRSASLTFADVDRDGDLDVIVANGRHWPQANQVFINNGAPEDPAHIVSGGGYGRFTLGYPLGAEWTTSYAVPAGDLDGDGDLDVVVGNDRAHNLIYMNDGSGRFSYAGRLADEADLTRDIQLADLNGDGWLDVAVANRRAENVIYLNDGRGGFGARKAFGTSDDSTIKLALGDLDEDGDLDLVLANRDGNANMVYLNDGQAGFDEARPFGSGRDESLAVAVADLNGDGHLAIITVNTAEPNAV